MEYMDLVTINPQTLTPYTPSESTVYGYNAGVITSGVRNTYIGFQAADGSLRGDDNVVVGWDAGRQISGSKNVLIGNADAPNLAGNMNVFVGYSTGLTTSNQSNITCVGSGCSVSGDNPVVCGSFNTTSSDGAIVVGTNNQVVGPNSIVIGSYAQSVAANAIIIGNATYDSIDICGMITGDASTGITVTSNISVAGVAVCPKVAVGDWTITFRQNDTTGGQDLIMFSQNNFVSFDDTFEPGVLNFTGQHRCAFEGFGMGPSDLCVGKIVRSTGKYRNLDDDDRACIDESVPVVTMTTTKRDPAVFGVISGFRRGDFKIGNLVFRTQNDVVRVVINSVGEGGIWVCDEEGDFVNGDLVVSSSLPGHGCKQADDIVRSCTIAKITCDCKFSEIPVEYRKVVANRTVAFVGCIYKC